MSNVTQSLQQVKPIVGRALQLIDALKRRAVDGVATVDLRLLAAEQGLSYHNVAMTLSRLRRRGVITKIGACSYVINEGATNDGR